MPSDFVSNLAQHVIFCPHTKVDKHGNFNTDPEFRSINLVPMQMDLFLCGACWAQVKCAVIDDAVKTFAARASSIHPDRAKNLVEMLLQERT